MAGSQGQILYTYLTSGSPFANPSCRAVELSTAEVYSRQDPMHVGTHYTVQGCNSIEPLREFNDNNDMKTYPLQHLVDMSEPLGENDLYYVTIEGNGADGVTIITYDDNNQVIPYGNLSISIIFTYYNLFCFLQLEPFVGNNIFLAPTVHVLDGLQTLSFTLLGEVSIFAKALWDIPFDYILLGTNPTQWAFWDDMLNGYYGDSEGVAPTGGEGGGGGLYWRPNETVPIPSLPSLSVCDTGFVSLYSPSAADLVSLSNFLWSPGFYDNIIKNFHDPLDNIVSLQMIPFTPLLDSPTDIIIGNLNSGVQAPKLSTTYFELDCGQINVTEYYKTFADFSPYLKIHLALPYCGIIDINPDDCMGGYIHVVYHIDVFSGSCVAFVSCNTGLGEHVLSQHSGNILNQFPVTGANFASVYIGAINAIGSLASGNVMGAISQGLALKPEYQRSGGVTSVAGLLGIQYPYIIYSSPQYIVPENFRDVKGYTSNLKVNIGSASGYLQATADNSELTGIGCTTGELDMIRQLLAEGIYV